MDLGSGTQLAKGLKSRKRFTRAYWPDASAGPALSRSRSSLPVLKKGTFLAGTLTAAPVRGLRPTRAGRCLHEKRAKSPEFDPVAPRQGRGDFVEDRRYDPLDVTLIQMGIRLRETENQLGFYHRDQPSREHVYSSDRPEIASHFGEALLSYRLRVPKGNQPVKCKSFREKTFSKDRREQTIDQRPRAIDRDVRHGKAFTDLFLRGEPGAGLALAAQSVDQFVVYGLAAGIGPAVGEASSPGPEAGPAVRRQAR